MKSEYDIFFSYSHRDSEIAKQLVWKLEESGLTCFLAEKDIGAGELWESRIRKAILGSRRIVLLITPRSVDSLWVAAEAGAGWALEKDLIAALMFIDPDQLIDPIKRYQGRTVETEDQIAALIDELRPDRNTQLDGQWMDPSDDDKVFFRQNGNRVVGFYDYGSGTTPIGVYLGVIEDKTLDYSWRWLDPKVDGHGRGIMELSPSGRSLSGEWWSDGCEDDRRPVGYNRVSDRTPNWLDPSLFAEYQAFLDGTSS